MVCSLGFGKVCELLLIITINIFSSLLRKMNGKLLKCTTNVGR